MTQVMTYPDFKEYIISQMSDRYPDADDIQIRSVLKNNGLMLDGLTIHTKDRSLIPTIYLNDFYTEYQKGMHLEQILQHIQTAYGNNLKASVFCPDDFCDFEKIKDRIVFRLINRQENETLLGDVPFIPYLDLALVFCVLVELDTEQSGSIMIHHSHLSYWNVDEKQLFAYAKINSSHLLQPECTPLEDMVESMLRRDDAELFPSLSPAFPMYILTNNNRSYGAGVICYPDLLESCAEKLEDDFYIIPSSIHEVIIVPSQADVSLNFLSDMVREVNQTQLAREEVLSDHAYFYDRKANVVRY